MSSLRFSPGGQRARALDHGCFAQAGLQAWGAEQQTARAVRAPHDCDLNTADAKAAFANTRRMPLSPSPAATPPRRARDLLAENILVIRRSRGWSQEELAYEAGLHRTFVAHVERGSRNIALDNVEKLARALRVEPYELLKPRKARSSPPA